MSPGPGIFRTYLPKGFYAGGINCGVRRYRPDLGIILSDTPCVAVGLWTQNTCKAAPVKYCEDILPASNIRAIITNSGQANAATGPQGILDNQAMAWCVAEHLRCDPTQVLTASTGVIGEPLSMDKIIHGIPRLLNSVTQIAEKFALAILTTDLVPKTVRKELQLSCGTITLTGICKGSGMIHPNMATMLGYILTDAKLNQTESKEILVNATDKSFNMISVDGETSTNDSVFLLANGASGVPIDSKEDFDRVHTAVEEMAIVLAKSIASDGEGASKRIEVHVKGTPDVALAKQIARDLTISPLLKTALYGESPNWGRILARVGAQQIKEDLLASCRISIEECPVYPVPKTPLLQERLSNLMKGDDITICLDFSSGPGCATAWGCDLTEKYIKINAEYLT